MIRVMLVDDHQMFMEGLSDHLEREKDIEQIDTATDGKIALKILEVKHNEIDVVVMDIEMDRMGGIETTKQIKTLYPEIKVLILSMYNDSHLIKELLKLGASGYILKSESRKEFVNAIKTVGAGAEYLSASATKAIVNEIKDPKVKIKDPGLLTKREQEVINLIAKGLSSLEIAEKLFIARSTVETHRRSLIEKTEVKNSKELIGWAIQNGYCDSQPTQ